MSTTAPTTRRPDSSTDQSGTEDVPAGKEPLTEDDVFHLLQCRRRRDALRYLDAHGGGPVTMRDLAEQVAAWEHDTTLQALTSKERQRVYIPLYQTHLPKLDDAGVIDYDQHRGRVTRTPLADSLRPYLEVDDAAGDGEEAAGATAGESTGATAGESTGATAGESATADATTGESPAETTADGGREGTTSTGRRGAVAWSRYFAGASTVAVVGLAVTVAGTADVPGLAAAVVLFVAFGLLTLARTLDERRRDDPGDSAARKVT